MVAGGRHKWSIADREKSHEGEARAAMEAD